MTVTLHHGDCLEFMRTLPAGSVDAVVTDPPYGIGYNPQQFKKWDGSDSSFQRIADAQAQPALIGGAA